MSLTPFLHLDDSLAGLGAGATLALAPDARRHLHRVLRLGPGATVEVADGLGRSADGVLADAGVELTSDVRVQPAHARVVTVAQAPPKGRGFDDVVRNLTELDVDVITPLRTERGVARHGDDRLERASTRWRAVARAASEQSRRPWRTILTGMRTLDEVTTDATNCLVAHPGGRPLPRVVEELGEGDLTLVVGPEGGFSDAEIALCAANGAEVVGMGRSVLRTGHAAAAGVAVIASSIGRWG